MLWFINIVQEGIDGDRITAVVIITHTRADYLKRCLQAVFRYNSGYWLLMADG